MKFLKVERKINYVLIFISIKNDIEYTYNIQIILHI